jgi:hypothetical protein
VSQSQHHRGSGHEGHEQTGQQPERRGALGAIVLVTSLVLGAVAAMFVVGSGSASAGGPTQPAFECGTIGYLFQDVPTDAFEVDLVTGDATSVASNLLPDNLNSLGYNPADDYLYATQLGGADEGAIYRIGSDYSVVRLGLPAGATAQMWNSGEFDAQGRYWVAHPINSTSMRWMVVDLRPGSPTYMQELDSGTATIPNASNVVNPGDWAFNPQDGQLYFVGRSTATGQVLLYRFNPVTHVVTLAAGLGTFSPSPVGPYGAIYTDSDGYLYASDNLTGLILRVDISAGSAEVFSQGPATSRNDGARCFNAPTPIDFGDAPDSYGTVLADDGPRHGIAGYDASNDTGDLMLGSNADIEPDGFPSAGADGDDLDDVADEDAFAGPIGVDPNQPTYELDVPFTNDTGDPATLAGWIDFDANGTFDADERATVTVNATGTATLTWTIPADAVEGDSYARFRIFPGNVADPSPLGAVVGGEVEDHQVVLAALEVDKVTVGGLVANGDGTYTATYDITVTNPGVGTTPYDLDDELRYGAGITVVSAGVANVAPGSIPTNPQWDGVGDTEVVAGATIAGQSSHTYRVTAVVTVAEGIDPAATDCAPAGPGGGTGLLNGAILTDGTEQLEAEACLAVPDIGIDKAIIGTPTPNGNGTSTLVYELTVTNGGTGAGVYDLVDELQLGAGITVVGTPTVANTAPGGIATNPAWDGAGQTGIVSGQAIGGSTTHVYRVTVVVDVPTGIDDGDADCQLDAGEGGTGLSNTASIDANGEVREDEDCAPVGSVTVGKELVVGPTANGDGTYTLGYDITVTGSGAASSTYDLTDELQYGAGITVDSATVANTSPGGIATNPAWDGVGDLDVVTGETITATGTHVYRVTVVVSVGAGLTPASSDCQLGGGEGGTGFLNSATLTSNGEDQEAEDCAEVGLVEIAKALVGQPVANGDGTYTVSYDLTVTNVGTGATSYDLEDELQYGAGTTVDSAVVANTAPGGIATNPAWDGAADTGVVSGRAIAGGTTHVYRVTVVAAVPADLSGEAADCDLGPGEGGTGLLNSATLTENGEQAEAEDCAELPAIEVDKTLVGTPVENGDGTSTVTYEIDVTNASATTPGSYDLTDQLQYGAGITVVSAGVANTAPGGIATDPSWDGATQTDVVTGQAIGPAQVHTYLVTVVVTVPAATTPGASDCALAPGEGGTGLLNGATLSVNGQDTEAEACAEVPVLSITKALVGDPVGNGDGTYTITYDITVTNDGSGPGTYDLDDRLQYGAGTTVDSAAVANTTPGGIATNAAWDGTTDVSIVAGEAIGASTTHVYRVTVVAAAPSLGSPSDADCELGGGEAGTGFLNSATLTSNGLEQDDDACAPTPRASFEKDLVGTPVANGDGTYTITYDITVTNDGEADVTYDLSDQLRYGAGVTVSSASVANTSPGGIATNPSWDGDADPQVVTGQALAGGAVHVYRVVVVADVAQQLAPGAGDCELGGSEAGTGFLNEAAFAVNGEVTRDEACAELPSLSIDKTVVGAPTANGDGTFTQAYDITVGNGGSATGTYDLDDVLTYGGGITVVDADVANTTPGGITTNPAWDGQGTTSIVSGRQIAGGDQHVYRVTVVVEVDAGGLAGEASDCVLGAGEGGTGLLNTSTLSSNGVELEDDACNPLPDITITKALVGSPVPQGDGSFTVTYDVTVRNGGAGAGEYDLEDALAYGAGITIDSAAVQNTVPGGIATNGGWDGVGDTEVVADQAIAGGGGHTYRVTVRATPPTDLAAQPSAGDCALGGGEAGTGFLNTATVTSNGQRQDAEDCAPVPTLTIDKEVRSGPTANGDGTTTLTYAITVDNPTEAPTTYDLDDTLRFGTGVVVDSASVSNDQPGSIGTNASWDGVGDTSVTTGTDIAPMTTHVYLVTVTVALDDSTLTPTSGDCELGGGEDGTGLRNDASITWNGSTDEDDECVPIGIVGMTKALVGTTENGDGTVTATYDIVVTNVGGAAGTYDLADQLRYGAGVTILSSGVANTTPGGITTNPAWNGTSQTAIVSGQAIAADATHVFRVTARVRPDVDLDPVATDCRVGGGEAGSGLLNGATLTSDGVVTEDDACAELPRLSVDKQLVGAPVANGDGTWTLTYDLSVANDGAAPGTYDLADDLRLGTGMTVQSASVQNTAPGGITTNGGWNGTSQTTIVTDEGIGAGSTHVYRATVVVGVPVDVAPDATGCDGAGGGDGGGFANGVELVANGVPQDDEACAPAPAISIDKELLGEPVVQDDGSHVVTYRITVTNDGAGNGRYHLDDELRFGAGVEVATAEVSNIDPGTIDTEDTWDGVDEVRIATDVGIASGVSHTYEVVVTTDPALSVAEEAGDCELGGSEDGTGFLNTATVTTNGLTLDDDACAEVATAPVEIVKSMLGDPVADGSGGYTVRYRIEVSNPGDVTTVYDLDDRLRYGAGISVTDAEVSDVEPGSITTDPDWDGLTATRVATAVTIGAGVTHTYEVTVEADLATGVTQDQLDCDLDGNETGTGFLNEATARQGSVAHHDDACARVVVKPDDPTNPRTPNTVHRPSSGGSVARGRLAYTGASIGGLVLLGLALILGGTVLMRRHDRSVPRVRDRTVGAGGRS